MRNNLGTNLRLGPALLGLLALAVGASVGFFSPLTSRGAGFVTDSNGCEWFGDFNYTSSPAALARTYGDPLCTDQAVLNDVQWTWNNTYYSAGWMRSYLYYITYSISQANDGDSGHQIKPAGYDYGQVVWTYLS
jgi:hypothetical protein